MISVLQPVNKINHITETSIIHDQPSSSKIHPLSQTNSSKNFNLSQKSSLSIDKKSEKSKIVHDKSKTSKIEEHLNTSKNLSLSKKSVVSKTLGNKLSLKKKKSDNCSSEISPSLPNQNVNSYLTSKEDQLEPEEKVKSWLEKNLTPEADNDLNIDSELKDSVTSEKPYVTERRPKESPVVEDSSPSQTNICDEKSKEMDSSKEIKKYIDKSFKDSKCKNIQKSVQYADMIAKRRKLNQIVPEKSTLKTTPTVPATSHDWKRVKKVGREMQAKTFKSLNVSIEKSTPSIVLDDTVQCHSTSNEESKSASREIDSSGDAFVTKRRRFKKKSSDNIKDMGSSNPMETVEIEKNTIDLSESLEKENNSSACMSGKRNIKVSAVQNNQETPEKVQDASNILHDSSASKSKKLTHKTRLDKGLCENEQSDDSFDSTGGFKNSLARRKLSLKKTLKSSENSKLNLSSPLAGKTEENEVINKSPEKPKSKLSLRLQMNTSNEKPVIITKSPANIISRNKSPKISKSSFIIFKKLSRFSKKRKNIPFLYLGKVKLKNTTQNSDELCGLISVTKVDKCIQVDITSNQITANFESSKMMNKSREVKMLSPEKDSQLKFLTIETPAHQQQSMDMCNEMNKSKTGNCNQKQTIPMETEEIASTSKVVNQLLESREEVNKSMEKETIKTVGERNKDVMEPSKNVDENNTEDQTETNYHSQNSSEDVEMRDVEPVLDIHPEEIEDLEDMIPESSSFRINSGKQKIDEIQNVDETKSLKNVEIDHVSESSSISKTSSNKKKTDDVQEVISISSHDSEFRNCEINSQKSGKSACTIVSSKSNNNISGSEGYVESEFSITKRRNRKKPQKQKSSSLCSSNASSRNKKRNYSNDESSNDEDLPSILGKWTCSGSTVVPKSKKQKLSLDDDSGSIKNNKQSSSESYKIDDRNSTLMDIETELKQPERVGSDKNPPNSDALKVKNSKEKEAPAKIINMPSSLLSADLFESHQPFHQASPKQLNKIISDHSSRGSSPNRNKDKDKDRDEVGSTHSSNFTMSELIKFPEKSNLSECSDGSNKENYRDENKLPQENCPLEKINDIDDLISEIGSSQVVKEAPQKQVPPVISSDDQFSDSIMNITQEQVNLKNIEEALLGESVAHKDKNEKTTRRIELKPVEEQVSKLFYFLRFLL